ncbi:diguanylate cyclase domain-containing protein [Spongorhabdus nitratireducens]
MDGTQVKLLVVDDRPENLLAMDKLLKPLGAEIHKANSGEEALKMVLRHHFALILLDVQMPGMDGFETAALLHSNSQTASIPIIFVTALNKDEAYVSKGYKTGAVDYLPKPINPDILMGKVKVFLRLEQQHLEMDKLNSQLKAVSKQNQMLLDCAGEGIVGVNPQGHVVFSNPVACQLLGVQEQELKGQKVDQYLADDSDSEEGGNWVESRLHQDCLKDGSGFQHKGNLRPPGRASFPAEFNVSPILDDSQQVTGAVIVFQDITERQKLEDKLIRMARYDNLTGLANRSLFMEFINTSIARSQRRERTTAVAFIDLDHFKQINDTMGHDAGDDLLISAAARLKTCVREGDMVARLGGDEFAIVLDDLAKPQDAAHIAEKILQSFSRAHLLGKKEVKVGTSIGIATFPDAGKTAEEIIKAADTAMYVSKKSGRNSYNMYQQGMKVSGEG